MNRLSTIPLLLFAGILMLVLFALKYEVQDLEAELTRFNRDIITQRQSLHVLTAEWSHFNDPDRLRSLAERHLALTPVTPEQLASIDSIPQRSDPPPPIESSAAAKPLAAVTGQGGAAAERVARSVMDALHGKGGTR